METSIRENIDLFANLGIGKIKNAARVWSSYSLSRITGFPFHSGMPISISFEPTTSCNLRCPECPSGLRSFSRPTGMLDPQFFKNTIDQLADTLCYLLFYFQGEPFLHPRFLELVNYASCKGIYTATSTNAQFLSDKTSRGIVTSGLDKLIISIDGTTQETYESYRVGGSLNKVLEGTRNIIRWKKSVGANKPIVVFQFLVVAPNEHQIQEIKILGAELEVDDVVFKTAQIYDFKNGSSLMPRQDRFSRYKLNGDGEYHIKNKLSNHCWKMWHSCVITWDGKVVPCCFDKDAAHIMGDLNKNSFNQIWNGEKYRLFRASLLKNRKNIDICKNCTEGTKTLIGN